MTDKSDKPVWRTEPFPEVVQQVDQQTQPGEFQDSTRQIIAMTVTRLLEFDRVAPDVSDLSSRVLQIVAAARDFASEGRQQQVPDQQAHVRRKLSDMTFELCVG